MTQQIPFEYMALAIEGTSGTAEATPDVYMNLMGTLLPQRERFAPDLSSGVLAERMQSVVTREYGQWTATGPVDADVLPYFLEMFVDGNVTASQPGTAADTYQWVFAPQQSSSDIQTATIFFGDPNKTSVQRGAYGFIDTFRFSLDASGTDGVTIDLGGMTQMPTKFAAPTMPSQAFDELIPAITTAVFLDTSSAIGTTELTAILVSAEFDFNVGINPVYLATGEGGSRSYTRTSRSKQSVTARITLTFNDYTQWDIAAADTDVKLRVVTHGSLIENDAGTDYYNGFQFDVYGPLHITDYGDLDGAERTITFEVQSEYDTTAGTDYSITVTNELDALAA